MNTYVITENLFLSPGKSVCKKKYLKRRDTASETSPQKSLFKTEHHSANSKQGRKSSRDFSEVPPIKRGVVKYQETPRINQLKPLNVVQALNEKPQSYPHSRTVTRTLSFTTKLASLKVHFEREVESEVDTDDDGDDDDDDGDDDDDDGDDDDDEAGEKTMVAPRCFHTVWHDEYMGISIVSRTPYN